jgi:hypothetical protein
MLTRLNAAALAGDYTEEFSSLSEAGARRVYLAALPPELGAPLALGGHLLQRLRLIVLVPGGGARQPRADRLIGPLPSLASRHALLQQSSGAPEVIPRPVRGEILRDECGRFYERVGKRIRPIAELAASADGQPLVLEARVIREPEAEADGDGVDAADGQMGATARAAPPRARSRGDDYPGDRSRPRTELLPPVQMLFASPGLWRVVPFGEFRPMLAPQLAHPERLRESHQLPCYLQVHEACADMPAQQFVQAVPAATPNPELLQPWSESWAVRLQVSLPAARIPRRDGPEIPGVIRAGSRYFRLQVASDPTVDAAVADRPAVDVPAQAPMSEGKTTPSSTTAASSQFRVSRDEAVYDLQLAAAREGALRRLSLKLMPPVKRADLRKWHALLAGKSPEQQLWQVNPPRNGLRDPRVRKWIGEAIRLAGDPRATLDEWEIYWRRRGLS